jgi:membrane-bound metal-dependent hydrolase YbcI (DUF457 family)
MPRWEVHISVASMALVVIITGCVLGILGPDLNVKVDSIPLDFMIAMGLGSMGFLLGSVLPDIDGKGKVRWTIGPMIGAFAIIPPVIHHLQVSNLLEAIQYLWDYGTRSFFIFTLVSLVFALFPKKHRGWFHSIQAGMVLSTVWGGYIWWVTGLEVHYIILIIAMKPSSVFLRK